ncbi:MAG TPA: peroxidase family protein [Aldersonia sp.]
MRIGVLLSIVAKTSWRVCGAILARESAPATVIDPAQGAEGDDPSWRAARARRARAENEEFEKLALDIMQVQTTARKRCSRGDLAYPLQRALHAKATLAVDNAELRFFSDKDLPADLRVGFARPDAKYRTVVRFSNANSCAQSDHAPDLRGIALRVHVGADKSHDLLATNFPVSHARDARQFVEFAKRTAGGNVSRAFGLLSLVKTFGIRETVRMVCNVSAARRQSVSSVATQTYWSRAAMTWGPAMKVRFLFKPKQDRRRDPKPDRNDPNYLSTEAARRLEHGAIRFDLCIQRYVNETLTPIEDTAIEWTEANAPAVPIATLTLPQTDPDVDTEDAQARADEIDRIAFNPWNTTEDFLPLGNLNRARKAVYDASAAHRDQLRWHTEMPVRNVVFGTLARKAFPVLNRCIKWYRLPARLALLNLHTFREVLWDRNLIDTEPREEPPHPRTEPPKPPPEKVRWARTTDGSYNDLSAPAMGAVGATFGRNLEAAYPPDLTDDPNPVTVSRELLTRGRFLPARSLNLIAAAWVQFQVHDWVKHERYRLGTEHDVVVPLPDGQTWLNARGRPREHFMRIRGNKPIDGGISNPGPVFRNEVTHWWDGSELYGSDDQTAALRRGPKIRLTYDGQLPTGRRGIPRTGFEESWWIGLSALHTLFAREHNVVCDELRSHYKDWSDDRVYQTARLIVSALIAKIHTVEWTPAILAREPIDLGMKANWAGPPSNDWVTRLGAWLFDVHASVGIPDTVPDHHGVPFSLTEDFVAVYRLHPLIPDHYRFVDHQTGEVQRTCRFPDITGRKAERELGSLGLTNVMYSLGLAHPGAITLNNYPSSLQNFPVDGNFVDLSVVDIIRDRERLVPRYNDFRAGLHKRRIRCWEQLSDDREAVACMRELYGSIDRVDTMIGLFAETPPEGFGFSDTAFRLFILMASRRIQSDRFLTVDFRPEIYSPLGMDWIQKNSMTDVILRHCPDVAALLPRNQTAFAPWRAR